MRRSAGFTLIELVIVIVILGILGAVAAPKFLNLQDEAYGAGVKSMASSLQSAAMLSNTQAILKGVKSDKTVDGYGDTIFINDYPAAITDKGIFGALQSKPSTTDYDIKPVPAKDGNPRSVTLQPKNRSENDCIVTYFEATSTETAKVTFNATCS